MSRGEKSLEKPLLIYDGDCGFCRRSAARWEHATQGRVAFAPVQEVSSRFPKIPPKRFKESVVFVDADGVAYFGAEAVFRTLSHAPGKGWLLALYKNVPGFALVSEFFYRYVARHRGFFSNLTRR